MASASALLSMPQEEEPHLPVELTELKTDLVGFAWVQTPDNADTKMIVLRSPVNVTCVVLARKSVPSLLSH